MNFPAVAIAICFASGIAMGLWPMAANRASIAQQPKPKNYVLNVLNSGELDLHAPLRWHGILRDEPATLPWGTSYEIEQANVAYQERSVSIQGGLRASYTPHDEQLAAPITAQVNSAKPKTPQDQQSNQQQ